MTCLSVQTRISIRVLAFLVISPATAADLAETARKAQAAYAAAQREWQIGLAELAVEQRPEFEAIAKAQRDLQVAYLERGTSKFEYLMAEDPSRIVLTEGLSQFINYDWSDEDTQTLREADPGYAALDVKVAALRKSNDDQRDWGSFREYFRNTLLKSIVEKQNTKRITAHSWRSKKQWKHSSTHTKRKRSRNNVPEHLYGPAAGEIGDRSPISLSLMRRHSPGSIRRSLMASPQCAEALDQGYSGPSPTMHARTGFRST